MFRHTVFAWIGSAYPPNQLNLSRHTYSYLTFESCKNRGPEESYVTSGHSTFRACHGAILHRALRITRRARVGLALGHEAREKFRSRRTLHVNSIRVRPLQNIAGYMKDLSTRHTRVVHEADETVQVHSAHTPFLR